MRQLKWISILDIIVTVLIGGLMSGFLSINFSTKNDTARDAKRMTAVADIKGSIERYMSRPENVNVPKTLYLHKRSLSNVIKDPLGKHHVITVDVDSNFFEVLKGLDIHKPPMDPLGNDYYRFGIAYTNNPSNLFNVAATLEYNGKKRQYNTYIDGRYKEGLFDWRKSLVAAYQNSYPATIKSTGDYVYNGSTDPLLPYRLDD